MEETMTLSICEEDRARLQRDQWRLTRIFPDVVWLQLLQSIEDPAHLEDVGNASLYLRSLLLSGRCARLFPRVWVLIAPEFKKDLDARMDAEIQRWSREQFEDFGGGAVNAGEAVYPGEDAVVCGDCGRSRQAQWFSAPLALRLVCHQWNRTLESAYVDEAQRSFMGSMGNIFNDKWLSPAKIRTWTDSDPSDALPGQILLHFNRSHGSGERSPFLRRDLTITFEPPREENPVEEEAERRPRDDFLEDLLSLLSKYGHHLWFCHITFLDPDGQLPIAQHYTILMQFLQFLPNIRCLSINFDDFHIDGMGEAELEQAIRTHPPPTFPQLEYLNLGTNVSTIDNAVMSKNTHTRALMLDSQVPLNLDLIGLSFQNLSELGIQFTSPAEFYGFYGFIALRTNFQLGKVYWVLPGGVRWQDVFSCLEAKWGNTLTCVTLCLPLLSNEEKNELRWDASAFQLRLPQVTQLCVTMREVTSMDFLLPVKNSLREMEVSCFIDPLLDVKPILRMARDVETGAVVKLMGAAEHFLEERNVWEQFPHLQRLKFFLGDDRWPFWTQVGSLSGDYRREDWMRWRNRVGKKAPESSRKSRCLIL